MNSIPNEHKIVSSIDAVDVSFITVNYNTVNFIEKIILFFRACTLPFTYQLIVVDNGSTDGSDEILKMASDVTYLPLYVNCGYGAAINRGLSVSKSTYAVVMNTDIELTEIALVRLWSFMEETPIADWAAPLVVYPDGRQQGFVFHPSLLSLYWIKKSTLTSSWYKIKARILKRPFSVPGLMGAFFWLRRSVLSQIDEGKLFDENYFFYYEDTDLAYRFFKKGFKAYVVPDVNIVHYGGGSTSINARSFFLKNRNKFITDHFGAEHANNIKALDKLRVKRKLIYYRIISCFLDSERFVKRYDKYKAELEFYDNCSL